jgi:hypothetical protein
MKISLSRKNLIASKGSIKDDKVKLLAKQIHLNESTILDEFIVRSLALPANDTKEIFGGEEGKV